MQALKQRTLTLTTLLACGLLVGPAQAAGPGADEGYGKPTQEEIARLESIFEEMLAAKAACGDACSDMCSGECATYMAEKAAKGAKPEKYAKKYAWDESAKHTASHVAKLLAEKPNLWPAVATIAKERFLAEATPPAHRAVILNLLAATYTEPALVLSGELFASAPARFSQDQIFMFAERKQGDFVKQVKALAVSNNGKKAGADIRPAAFMAFHGEDVGKRTLGRVVKGALKKDALQPAEVVDVLVAAAALDELERGDLLREVRIKIHESALAALDAGRIEAARDVALAGKYIVAALEEGQAGLSFLDDKVRLYCMMSAEELGTPEAVFELIEEITPM